MNKNKDLYALLAENEYLTTKKLDQVFEIAKDQDLDILDVLINQNFIEESTILSFLAEKLGF